jgi:hypothetical protein
MGHTCFYEIQCNTTLFAKMNDTPNQNHVRWGEFLWQLDSVPGIEHSAKYSTSTNWFLKGHVSMICGMIRTAEWYINKGFCKIKTGDRWRIILWNTGSITRVSLTARHEPSNWVSFRMGVTCSMKFRII